MRIQFKNQKFQAEAARAVVGVFAGQPCLTPSYMIDKGKSARLQLDDPLFTGWRNAPLVPELTDKRILENIRGIQLVNQLKPSDKLERDAKKSKDELPSCPYNLTIEMETGVGKTYTYIKTMYELNKQYGWRKFIVVVPSVAIREGVYKTFQMTEDHFTQQYGKKIRYFIYNSGQLNQIEQFASDSSIHVMIINSQAFNAKGQDARRIYMELDEFRSRRPIDVIAKTNPILIIDEPQSVEGPATRENLKRFNSLITLRYSATHKTDRVYNMVYRLDAMEAYNKRLVKKIAVKGVTETGSTATDGYVYLAGLNLSESAPTANIEFEMKGASGIRKVTRKVSEGFNLYVNSGSLEEYRDGFVVRFIDGRDNSVEFLNGIKLFAGDVIGKVDELQLRRIQIRETILSHLERERQLFHKGIKVLSLFFIDEVSKYKQYNANGQPENGVYADMFEQEYAYLAANLPKTLFDDEEYTQYLKSIEPAATHAGYFSVDKKGKMVDSKVSRKETTTDDVDAYDLIMKNKELLLDRNPKRSPVRFIFSHSALREGWDNPNVFQICTLKQSRSDVRKRQEVGRGLRLCVNQDGERMDTTVLGSDVHDINVLTVIASESYDSFAKGLQAELAEAVADRPCAVSVELFMGKTIVDNNGAELVIDSEMAKATIHSLISNGYIDKKGALTDKFHEDTANGKFQAPEEAAAFSESIIRILNTIYDPNAMKPADGRNNNVELNVDDRKLALPEFKELWSRINAKSFYVVNFETDELIRKAIQSLDANLIVSKIYVKMESGVLDKIESKEDLANGTAFRRNVSDSYNVAVRANENVKYDLIGKLVESTGLKRKTIIDILQGIQEHTFNRFKDNPEEFILKTARLINDQKATVIIEHIAYHPLEERYQIEIFTEPTFKGKLNENVMKTQKHLYDHLIYDSSNERRFAEQLDSSRDVAVYVKLPSGFFISTPVGQYNPDWAIAFYEDSVKHIYFVAETKGSLNSLQLRNIEEAKIHCAREHFKAISGDKVVYDVVDNYQTLLDLVTR